MWTTIKHLSFFTVLFTVTVGTITQNYIEAFSIGTIVGLPLGLYIENQELSEPIESKKEVAK